MVLHYQPERLRYNSDQPTAITDALVAASGLTSRTGEIPLGPVYGSGAARPADPRRQVGADDALAPPTEDRGSAGRGLLDPPEHHPLQLVR
jgi:hypothetical protein